MKTFVVILAIAAIASADIGLGYHYGPHKPQTSYETPSYSNTGSNSGYDSGYTSQSSSSSYKGSGLNAYQPSVGLQNGYPSQVLTSVGYQGNGYQTGGGYQTGTGYPSGSGYQSGYQTGTNTKYQTGGNYAGSSSSSGSQYQTSSSTGSIGLSNAPLQSGNQGYNQYQSSSQYESNAANYQQYYNQLQHQPPQIFKHFYVHAAPEEPELPRPRQPIVLPAPQKHYKIIFIKTPAPAAGSTQFVPVQQQNEEKTIVYVLVKKPEAVEDIVLPQIEQTPPSKPEVFFIKYKGKEDSQAVINNIVNEYNSGKTTVNVGDAGHSSGTLDSISDAKYASQSFSGSPSTGNSVTTSQSSSSFGSKYENNDGSGGQSFSSGSSDNGSSSSSFQSQSFESSTTSYPSSTAGYPTSTQGYPLSSAAPVQVSAGSGGFDSNFANSVSSSTTSYVNGGYDQSNTIASNQGIPHETYGPPKFRDN